MPSVHGTTDKGIGWLVVAALLGLLGLARPVPAAEFSCAAGDVTCLISAITTANATGEAHTIALAAGTYTLTAVDNTTTAPNGLPLVTGALTIRGAGAGQTVIERAADAPDFRLGHVAPTGRLTLEGLTLRGGYYLFGAGGLRNEGGLALTRSLLAGNGGGGIENLGSCTLLHSTLAHNYGGYSRGSNGGGLANYGIATVAHTTVVGNSTSGTFSGAGGGIKNGGTLTLVNSTLTENGQSVLGEGGGLYTFGGTATLLNSTLTRNQAGIGGGIRVASGTVVLQNTLLALNVATTEGGRGAPTGPDCAGPVTSLGHNLIGQPRGCTVTLLPGDRIGDPGLGHFTEAGVPGRGHVPLLPGSRAIAAGHPEACPPTDQLGRPHDGRCDIGAVEFQSALAAFVTGFYEHGLERPPSPPEVAEWMGFLQADPTLARAGALVHAIFDGPEYRARPVTPWEHVTALYRALLGREPEPEALEWWVGVMLDLLNTALPVFLEAPEFHGLVPGCHEADAVTALVTRLYEEGLGRTPGAAEVRTWTSAILTACDLAGAVEAFFTSAEYLSLPRTLAAHVTTLYRALLAREPAAEEETVWVDELAGRLARLEEWLLQSPEFQARWHQLFP